MSPPIRAFTKGHVLLRRKLNNMMSNWKIWKLAWRRLIAFDDQALPSKSGARQQRWEWHLVYRTFFVHDFVFTHKDFHQSSALARESPHDEETLGTASHSNSGPLPKSGAKTKKRRMSQKLFPQIQPKNRMSSPKTT
jgi:hypothetical protein